ncbi:MAG TPA: iron ABC transporter permease, partial [Chloroflexota bacterium]|nr:iron ABC transporter permease [Chloroflexota bacterium]
GWVWVAVHSMRDFTFPLMLGTTGNVVLAALIWKLWRQPDLPGAAALSILLAVILGGLAGLGRSFLASRVEEAF